MKLSYVIVTHQRREPLLKTLAILFETTPPQVQGGTAGFEVWVVDNASTDGTCEAVRAKFPSVKIIEKTTNEGVWARSAAFAPAKGEYLILLDDDSYPIGDAVSRSIAYLDAHAECAAVVGKVVLPDGSQEGCAFPAVMLSGAVCIRRNVLLKVGGFRPEFFRKAGEYDLSYRIWQAGYRVDRFEDVVYRHDKVMTGRSKPFAHRMDLRNNLILVERYLPASLRNVYRRDVIQRYSALARHDGCGRAAWQARLEGMIWRVREALGGRQTLSEPVVETLYQMEYQAGVVGEWARTTRARRVVIADFSKNLYATFDACRRAGLEVVAVADDHPAYAGLNYRGVPVVSTDTAVALKPDGMVVSNINPAQCRQKTEKVRGLFPGPVLSLWTPAVTGIGATTGQGLKEAA